MVKGKKIVCQCMDISEDDLRKAIREGYNHIETLKRYSGACMGPCQGKFCTFNIVKFLANELNKSPDQVYIPTIRPPVKPIPLSSLTTD